MQFRYGGPIIAIQVENEYGSYDDDKGYMRALKEVRQYYMSHVCGKDQCACQLMSVILAMVLFVSGSVF